jgi:RNA recognition motif-containing protein
LGHYKEFILYLKGNLSLSRHMESKLFVRNFPFDSQKSDLENLFSTAGVVVDVHIPTDRETGRPRGFAFVEMGSPEEAQKAISMFNEQDFQGRALSVSVAQPRPDRPSGGGGGFRGGHGGGGRDRGGGGGRRGGRR